MHLRLSSLSLLCLALAGCMGAPAAPVAQAPVGPAAFAPAALPAEGQPAGRLELRVRREAVRALMATIADVESFEVSLTGTNPNGSMMQLNQTFDAALLNGTTVDGLPAGQGTLVFPALPPGDVSISVNAFAANAEFLAHGGATATIRAGQTTVAPVTLTLPSVVVANPNGALEADLTIRGGGTTVTPIVPAPARAGFPKLAPAATRLAAPARSPMLALLGGALVACPNGGRVELFDKRSGEDPDLDVASVTNVIDFAVIGTKIYAAPFMGDGFTALDTTDASASVTVGAGQTPGAVAAVGSKLYFYDQNFAVKALDVGTGAVTTVIPATPFEIKDLAADGTKLYAVANTTDGVWVFDTAAGPNPSLTQVFTIEGRDIRAIDVHDGKVYATSNLFDEVHYASTTPGSTPQLLAGGIEDPEGIVVDGNGDVYVSYEGGTMRYPAVR